MAKLVACTQTSVQPGSKRFPNPHDRPHIKQWRCDLTSLSRVYNLYFVASNDTILVYQPSFPSQELSSEPDLVLYPPKTQSHTPSGIDPYDPHSINRLLVEYLGRQEIILVGCDDGDVIGYRIDDIQRALEKRAASDEDEQEPIDSDDIRVFLHRNVGQSAWGLAVHREARMIAISANTHHVTVLAYALAGPDSDSDDSGYTEDSQLPYPSVDFPSPRKHDHVFDLCARANIPSVSFNNNGTDPTGRWLTSNSIDGKTIFWDLHNPHHPSRIIEVGYCTNVRDPELAPGPGPCACPIPSHVVHASWGTLYLDPRSAHQCSDIQEALGLDSDDEEYFLRKPPCFRDITTTKERFRPRPTSSFPMNLIPDDPAVEGLPFSDDSSNDMHISETDDEEYQAEENGGYSNDDGNEGTGEQTTTSEELQFFDSDGMSLDDAPVNESDPPTTTNQTQIVTLNQALPLILDGDSDDSYSSEESYVPPPMMSHQMPVDMQHRRPRRFYYHVDDRTDFDETVSQFIWCCDHGVFDQMARVTLPKCRVCGHKKRPTNHVQVQYPTTPCLIATKEEIFLIQRPLAEALRLEEKIITMRKPLHPRDPDDPGFPSLYAPYDRHSFLTQIPELGIFIIATPAGRVGIFSLTQFTKPGDRYSTFGFRLEYILPFSQLDENQIEGLPTPPIRLVGVAVGPIPGMLDELKEVESGPELGECDLRPRKWRLFLYWNDNTVVTYEISKARDDTAPEVGNLIV